ncbi:MAG: HRDC domain-containing protein [Candidatus Eisenbacteria bacterium]|jgi:ribonuclease D|nr:HRDC domain-containing protein [Candidatus Eisenbacteria bacterium]
MMDALSYTWIDSPEGFREMTAELAGAPRMALDTEGDSLYHYRQKVCLIQISTDRSTFVLDPLAVTDLTTLRGMMADSGVEKVFHAAGQDITWLRRDHGMQFARIFDTHMAAQLLGHERIGLDVILEELLGVSHSKHRQKDDWSRRPLSVEQIEYAATDTHHLLALRDELERRLREKGRLAWAAEEFELLAATDYQEKAFDPEDCRRIKGSHDLWGRQRAVLRALYTLREQIAGEMDLPPFRVIHNPVLITLARRMPRSPDVLVRCGVSSRIVQRHGPALLEAIETGGSDDSVPDTQPPRRGTRPSPATLRRVESLKTWRSGRAQELGIPVGVVLPGNVLTAIADAHPPDSETLAAIEGMRRWRVREFGQEILLALNPL